MKKTIALALTSAGLMIAGTASAATIADPGFESDFTAIGNGLTQADSASFDQWIYEGDETAIPRRWDQVDSGGSPGGYADGAFVGNNYNRTMYQVITDGKATTGLLDFTFDLNLDDNGADNGPLTISIWGVETSGSSFSLSTRSQDGVTSGNAIILGTQQFTTDTTGWEEQTISDVDFGTGYDLVIIGFWSARHDSNDPDFVGIDNVAFVPEPGSLALFALGGLCVLSRRRK